PFCSIRYPFDASCSCHCACAIRGKFVHSGCILTGFHGFATAYSPAMPKVLTRRRIRLPPPIDDSLLPAELIRKRSGGSLDYTPWMPRQGMNASCQSRQERPLASLVFPTYNPGPLLERTCREVHHFLASTTGDWEVLFVCDGCTDGAPV